MKVTTAIQPISVQMCYLTSRDAIVGLDFVPGGNISDPGFCKDFYENSTTGVSKLNLEGNFLVVDPPGFKECRYEIHPNVLEELTNFIGATANYTGKKYLYCYDPQTGFRGGFKYILTEFSKSELLRSDGTVPQHFKTAQPALPT